MSGRTGIWGKPEWQKTQYKTGKMIFCNATHLDTAWTPTGQDVTLTIGSTKVTLTPGQRYAYQPQSDRVLQLKAKPHKIMSKLGMKSGEKTIAHPLSYSDDYIWIWAGGAQASSANQPTFVLHFTLETRGPPAAH
jgi:hypothetical protein